MATAPKEGRATGGARAARDMTEVATLELLVHHVAIADRRAVGERPQGEAFGIHTDAPPENLELRAE